MTLLTILILIGMALAQDFDGGSYRYRIFSETVEDKQWTVQASNGLYDCTATIKCVGLDEDMIIRSHKPTWHDPLIIHYVVDLAVKGCELKSCSKLHELTYSDLKRR